MLLVYAMTRAAQHGWGTAESIVLLAAAAGLIGAFFVIEARSPAPLLPLRIFRLRTLSGSNFGGLMLGGSVFAEFFLLTLYMQQVLHYSAIKTGVAYIGLTLTIIVFSGVAQALVNRVGVRWVLPAGLALSTVALVLFAQLPVHAHYFSDLFPAFLISGLGLALSFVPMAIGALAGVRPADAGVASGLINTTQQVGGAIGVAVGDDGRDDGHCALRYCARRIQRTRRSRADPRIPGRVLRPGRHRRHRRAVLGASARTAAGRGADGHAGRRSPPRTRSRLTAESDGCARAARTDIALHEPSTPLPFTRRPAVPRSWSVCRSGTPAK